ncbi:MAG: leucine-rich repeat protein [Oscillospiraceae bacterium]|nr:leucine-rich repeat protein [Oscillospiraceae bacterium]
MKRLRKLLALTLAVCMMSALGVWNTSAQADWYTVKFTELENKDFAGVPTGTGTEPATKEDNAKDTATGADADLAKPGKIEYFYNPWAGTLVIRGKGAMPGFDEKHPAPWHTEAKRALRVIIEEGVTTISNEAFKDFERLRSVVFPSTLKKIAENAFEKCEKLKRVEVVIEIEDAKKLIEESKSEELLEDDVKIVRVTKEAICREVCWLTHYWLDRVEITYDKAGRPIRIIEYKIDGSMVDTGIKYLNPATAVNQAKNENTVERRYAVTTTRDGEKSAEEKEVNEYGSTLIKGEYELNKAGRQVKGTEVTLGDYGSSKRTLSKATYQEDGSGTKTWKQVYETGTTAKIVEEVDKKDSIKSIKTTYYDNHGEEIGNSETKNTYEDGRKIATTSTTNIDGNYRTENINYEYDDTTKQLKKQISETDNNGYITKVETSYNYDENGNLKKVVEENKNDGSSTTTDYSYDKKGLKTGSTIVQESLYGTTTTETKFDKNERAKSETVEEKDSDGNIVSTTKTEYSYNDDHVVTKSVATKKNADGSTETTVCTYDSDGRVIKSSTETVGTDGKKTKEDESKTFNSDGKVTSWKREYTDENGNTTTSTNNMRYDSQGRVLESKSYSPITGNTIILSYSYDSKGRVTEQVDETIASDGTKSGTITTYTYKEDGTYETDIKPINNTENTDTTTEAEPKLSLTDTEGDNKAKSTENEDNKRSVPDPESDDKSELDENEKSEKSLKKDRSSAENVEKIEKEEKKPAEEKEEEEKEEEQPAEEKEEEKKEEEQPAEEKEEEKKEEEQPAKEKEEEKKEEEQLTKEKEEEKKEEEQPTKEKEEEKKEEEQPVKEKEEEKKEEEQQGTSTPAQKASSAPAPKPEDKLAEWIANGWVYNNAPTDSAPQFVRDYFGV